MTKQSAVYESNAIKKTLCRGCISVEEQPYMDRFYKLDIKKLYTYSVNGAYVVEIPVNQVEKFVELYCQLMKPGYWNEYIGPKTGFFAKLSSGEVRHFQLTDKNVNAINSMMHELVSSWSLTTDLWEWLANVEIYSGWLKKN